MPPASRTSCAWPELSVPQFVEVVVEVPRGSFVKRGPSGDVDFVGPLPCPFNYGSVPSILAPDGDPLDAIVLGPTLPYGHAATWRVCGMLKFVDAGAIDNKLVCLQGPVPMAGTEQGHSATSGIRTFGRFVPHVKDMLPLGRYKQGESGLRSRARSSSREVLAVKAAAPKGGAGRCCPNLPFTSHGVKGQDPFLVALEVGDNGRGRERLQVAEYLLLTAFFSSYGVLKGALNSVRGKTGRTAFEGWDLL